MVDLEIRILSKGPSLVAIFVSKIWQYIIIINLWFIYNVKIY